MMTLEIFEDEYCALNGGEVTDEYIAKVLGSTPVMWLRTDDCSATGVIRRDKDGNEITYSFGVHKGKNYVGHGTDFKTQYEAECACIRAMTRRTKVGRKTGVNQNA